MIGAESSLYAASSVSKISNLLTFSGETVDIINIGGVIEAQGGSSGGAVVNAWNRLVGIITTTSAGTSTADRDLYAITLSYINRDLKTQTGLDIPSLLSGDITARTAVFSQTIAPSLLTQYLSVINK